MSTRRFRVEEIITQTTPQNKNFSRNFSNFVVKKRASFEKTALTKAG
jgi:hypothetical protein